VVWCGVQVLIDCREERLAAKKQREADEAFLDGLTTAVED